MKTIIINTIEQMFILIESILVFLLYGRQRQKKNGWRGQFAKLMASNYKKPSSQWKSSFLLLERIRNQHPELIKSSLSYLKWDYDFRLCQFLLGSEIDEWLEYSMYNKSWFYRIGCMTFWRNKFFNDYVNNRSCGCTSILDNKTEFASYWKDFFGRQWCKIDSKLDISQESFLDHFNGKRIIIKQLDGYGGADVKVFESEQLINAYECIKQSRQPLIVEEYINQTGLLHELNPSSLNTVRVCTLNYKNGPIVLFAKLRVGKEGEIVDNACAGGSLFDINVESGFLVNGSDYNGQMIYALPNSQPVKSFKIPRWDEVKEYCIKAHLHAPKELNLIGWDVCVSDNFICMIEGNANPAYGMFPNEIKNPWRFAKKYLDDFDKTRTNG